VFCATFIATGTSGCGGDLEAADSKDDNAAVKTPVSRYPDGFAGAPPVDTATTPRHHPAIHLFASITVLAGLAE